MSATNSVDYGSATARFDDIELLHPLMRAPARALLAELARRRATDPIFPAFRVFETYRSPRRQRYMLLNKRTKASPWESWHQWGLALDVVPIGPKGFTWEVDVSAWIFLKACAEQVGLRVPINWDRAHVQHPVCDDLLVGTRGQH